MARLFRHYLAMRVSVLQARQLWHDCANVTFRVEMHFDLTYGIFAIGGIFPLTINLQATITELYHAVLALLELGVAPVRISIIHVDELGYGQELAVPSEQPLYLARLTTNVNSKLVARIFYPAPVIAVEVRIGIQFCVASVCFRSRCQYD